MSFKCPQGPKSDEKTLPSTINLHKMSFGWPKPRKRVHCDVNGCHKQNFKDSCQDQGWGFVEFTKCFRSCAETRNTKIDNPIMGVSGGRASQAANGSSAQPEPENCICEASVQLWRLVCGGLPFSRICSNGYSGSARLGRPGETVSQPTPAS